MRILVTGGAGYIGGHAVRRLLGAGHEVTVLDDLSTGHARSAAGAPIVELDLVRDDLEPLFAEGRFDAVLHFAAKCLVSESVMEPAKYWRTNVAGGVRLLDALVARGPKRIVFSSTCATYGLPLRVPIDEDHPQSPITAYGRSKLAFEHALADYARAYGLGSIALRYFNAAGAEKDGSHGEDHHPETHLIPLVLRAAAGGPPVEIRGTDYPTPDGTCIRDYIHVDDLARAHILALERIEAGRALALNLGTGRGHSVREVVEAARRVTGRPIPSVEAARRPGDPPALVADPRRAREALGFTAERTLDDILRSAWKWHSSHPEGYGGKR
jgi:UDP-glucose-4-epimerase GalE